MISLTSDDLRPGSVVAGYRLDRLIGRGGMGVVFEATQLSLRRTVALKLVAPHLGEDVAFRARFEREGMLQASLDHPNVVAVHEAGEFHGTLFIAMRFVRGRSLKELIVGRELDAGRTLRLLAPVADALDAAHEAGLIHRDVKPPNILVGPRDHPYLADFGVARSGGLTAVTRTGQFVGSLDYLAPEQIRGEPVTPASDVYALGAVLFECLAGTVPFPKESEAAVLYAHVAEPPPRLRDVRENLPFALDDVIASAMAKEPGDRPATAGELIARAECAFSEQARVAMQVPAPIESPLEAGLRPPERAVATEPSERRGRPVLVRSVTADSVAPANGRAGSGAVGARPDSSGRRRRPWLIAAAVAAVAAAGGGVAVGASSSKKPAASATTRAVASTYGAVRAPAQWIEPAAVPSIPGLAVRVTAARRDPMTGAYLMLGTLITGPRPLLLPATLVSRLAQPPRGDAVRVTAGGALRYTGERVQGVDGQLTLIVLPTTRGVVTVACLAPPGGATSFIAQCEQAASGLKLVGGAMVIPLGVDARYAARLRKALDDRAAATARASTALRGAKTRRAQARALDRLATAETDAARAIDGAGAPAYARSANTRVAVAIAKVGHLLISQARDAVQDAVPSYRSGQRDVASAERTVTREFSLLSELGYESS